MTKRVAAGLAVAAALLAAPALAADHTMSAPGAAPLSYAQTDVTIDQGDTLTFVNNDSAPHSVTGANDASGKPIFGSAVIGQGQSAAVSGVQFLTTGDYTFHCSVHSFMTGTLHVTASGTPQQRPARDTTPPRATVAIADGRLRAVVKRKALRVTVSSNEPARFKLAAAVGRTAIAAGTLRVTDVKRRTAAIPLTKAGRRLLERSHGATVRLRAAVSDSAGNRSAANATRKLR